METLQNILQNSYIIWCIMAVIIFAVTQLMKLPIKHFTSKIKDERKRRIANATILLIPFAFGVLLDFLYSTYIIHQEFTIIAGIGYGTAGISLYSVIERVFKVKINNPYATAEGQAVIDLMDDITADGKVNGEDKSAVKEFLEKYKK